MEIMGLLVDGVWQDKWYETEADQGRFKRAASSFRNWVTADGSPGPSGEGGFKAEAGRYHLYVCFACPWAHRALIFRALKRLESMISLSVVHWHMGEFGWTFEPGQGVVPDPILGARYLSEIYVAADPKYTGRVTVPVLWDKRRRTIVNNESAEIIRMLNSAFDGITGNTLDFWSEALRPAIDEVNTRIYDTLNNGVYRAGFARSQEAYDEAAEEVFATLDWLEERLGVRRWLMGDRLTEADWRLATTLFRFDAVYHGHFKCNRRRLADYPNLWAYARELFQYPGVAVFTHQFHRVANDARFA
jgi:putative glutathione S-transferase